MVLLVIVLMVVLVFNFLQFRDNSQPTAVKGDPGTYGGGTAPTPGGWWFAGGGGAYTDDNYPISAPYGGPVGNGGVGGGGIGSNPPKPQSPTPGQANTGGGAGGGRPSGSGRFWYCFLLLSYSRLTFFE